MARRLGEVDPAAAAAPCAAAPPATEQILLVQYNILTPGYTKKFVRCTPAALDPAARWELLAAKLAPRLSARAIVYLQEVPRCWAGPLHALFASHGYTFLLSNYGPPASDYFGVGVAFHAPSYELLEASFARPATHKPWPVAPPPPPPSPLAVIGGTVAAAARRAGVALGALAPPPRKRKDTWVDSRERENVLVLARLRSRATGLEFVAATYHMPCAFYDPKLMNVHTALAAQMLQSFARGAPHVLAGDFNFKPESSAYALITTGRLDRAHPEYPAPPPPDAWTPVLAHGYTSAYAEALGSEPQVTNFAFNSDDKEPFAGCLDYIFLSPGVRAVSAEPLLSLEELSPGGPLPTAAAEPSDHVMLAACIEIEVPADSGSE